MIEEELVRIFRMMFGAEIWFSLKQVKAQKKSGVIYIPKRFKRKNAMVFILKDANKGTNTTG